MIRNNYRELRTKYFEIVTIYNSYGALQNNSTLIRKTYELNTLLWNSFMGHICTVLPARGTQKKFKSAKNFGFITI